MVTGYWLGVAIGTIVGKDAAVWNALGTVVIPYVLMPAVLGATAAVMP